MISERIFLALKHPPSSRAGSAHTYPLRVLRCLPLLPYLIAVLCHSPLLFPSAITCLCLLLAKARGTKKGKEAREERIGLFSFSYATAAGGRASLL